MMKYIEIMISVVSPKVLTQTIYIYIILLSLIQMVLRSSFSFFSSFSSRVYVRSH